MAKPNYAFQKRQRELAKKQKKEEKLKQKEAARQQAAGGTEPPRDPEDGAESEGNDRGGMD